MTNREKLKEMFPNTIFIYQKEEDKTKAIVCSDEWLDREYKEPITKNCESCRYYGTHHEACNYCYKCSLWTEKDSTTKNDLGVDCISRQAVIDNAGLSEWFDSSDSYNEFVFALNELPSVTPQEPRKGHWIRVDKDKLRCSECDLIHFIAQYPQGKIAWCPNCGAKMQEVEENGDK